MSVNNDLKGDSSHLTTLESTVPILKGWKPTGAKQQNWENTAATKNKDGVGFAQTGTGKSDNRKCCLCGKEGYHVRKRLDKTDKDKAAIYDEK